MDLFSSKSIKPRPSLKNKSNSNEPPFAIVQIYWSLLIISSPLISWISDAWIIPSLFDLKEILAKFSFANNSGLYVKWIWRMLAIKLITSSLMPTIVSNSCWTLFILIANGAIEVIEDKSVLLITVPIVLAYPRIKGSITKLVSKSLILSLVNSW